MNLSLSPWEILHIIFKRKALIKSCFFTLALAAAIGAFMQPTQYRAAGRILITGQEGGYSWLSLDENARIPPQDPDRLVNTEIEHIKSDDFLEKVAETLPFSLAARAASDEQGAAQKALIAVSRGVNAVMTFPSRLGVLLSSAFSGAAQSGKKSSEAGGQPRNPSVWPLHLGLEAIAVPNTSLIEVAFTDTDPQRAAKVVNTILDLYPPYRVKIYHDESAISFYDKQKKMLESEIVDTEKKIEEFETKENLSSVPEQREQIIDLMTKAEDRLRITDADIEQAKTKIAEIERQLAKQPETTVLSQDLADPEAKPLHESLVVKEVEKNELLQLYTEKDRRVQDKEREIASLKEHIAAAEGKKIVIGERVGPNTVYQSLVNELVEQKVKLGQETTRQKVYANQIQQLDAELDRLTVKGNELTRLQDLATLKKEQLTLYTKKAEEARIADAMDKEKLINVKAVNHSSPPSLPVPTKGPLLVVLAMFVGAGVGIGGALALDFLNPTFHSALDVERRLEIPVLALIPDLRAQEKKAKV